jgi:hypothetical protein
MKKIVVDTNVVVSALLRAESQPALVISLIMKPELELCRLLLSQEIFTEYKEVLSRPKFKQLDPRAVKNLLGHLKKEAHWIKPKISIDVIKDDPADNKFLECAVEGGADYIITGNIKHFPPQKFRDITILSPDEFLAEISKTIFE